MITKGRYTKVHASVLVTFTKGGASSLIDQPESVSVKSMWHSLIPKSASTRVYGQPELDQGSDDELPTDDCSTDYATEDTSTATNAAAWSSGIPSLVSTSTSRFGNPASISSPEDQADDDEEDTEHETAESYLVDPATVPLPEDDDSCQEGYEELPDDVGSLNEDILKGFEGVMQDYRLHPMSESEPAMENSIQDISSEEEIGRSPITLVELTGHPNYTPDPSLESCSMELGATFQGITVDELDTMVERKDSGEPTDFKVLNLVTTNSSGVPPSSSMDDVLAAEESTSTRPDDVSTPLVMDIAVDLAVPTNSNVTGTKGEADRGHQADHKQAEVLMDISRVENSGSDTTRAHLVPSISCPSVVSGSVPLAWSFPLLTDSDLTLTTSASCPGLLPSQPSVPASECTALEAMDFSTFSRSQTCSNIALEAHESSDIAESACSVRSMVPVSTGLPGIEVATDELAQVSSGFTRAPLDYGIEDTPVAGCSTTSLPHGSSGKEVPDFGVNDQHYDLDDGSRLLGQDTSLGPCGKNENLGECREQINDNQTAYAAPGPQLTEASNPCQKDCKKSPSAYRMDIKLYTRKVAKFEKMVEDVKAGRPLIGRDGHRKLPWLEKQLDKARGELRQAVEGLERKEKRAAERAEEAAARKARAIERKAAKADRKLEVQEAEREQE
ncbi:hypothetical protein RhiJN_10155 [Ceratobasidium sp. AG-Ba]|nr:hypothetical protein RhiJN_10155 [Ceratobasidium sp. AG-Ba]